MGTTLLQMRTSAAQVPTRRLGLAVALIALNIADVLLTKGVLHMGGVEGNPLMVGLMAGLAAPLGVKACAAAVAGALLFLSPLESRFADRAVATVVGLYFGVVMWNSALLGWLLVHAA